MKKKTNYFNVFKFAGAFVAFMIGSGFASGMEIMQFFASFGYWGLIAALISTVLFIWSGVALMTRGYDTKTEKNSHAFDYWVILKEKSKHPVYMAGKILSRFFEWLTPVFLFSIIVVMISGAGATMHQYFGIEKQMGCLIMSSIVLFSVFFGLSRLIDIIGMLGPVTILFTVGIALFVLVKNPEGLAQAGDALKTTQVPKAVGVWWIAGISYTAYNIMPAVPFLTSMGAEANTRKEAALGAILGTIMMMTSAILLYLAQLAYISDISELQIPNLFLAGLLPEAFSFIFSLILLGEIFSSAAPMLWITCDKFIKDGTFGNKVLAVVLSIAAYLGGQIPFGALVGTIYPYMGYIGIFLLICIFGRQMENRRMRVSKSKLAGGGPRTL